MPQLSFTDIGLTVVALIYLSRWLWDYSRFRREEAEQHEPKANPPLHATYATKTEHVELKERVQAVEEKVDENYKQLDGKRSASIAALHEKLEAQTRELNDRIDAVPERTIKLLRETQQLHTAR